MCFIFHITTLIPGMTPEHVLNVPMNRGYKSWIAPSNKYHNSNIAEDFLIKRIRTCTPPSQEQTKPDCLEDSAHSTYSNCVQRPLLGKNLADEL